MDEKNEREGGHKIEGEKEGEKLNFEEFEEKAQIEGFLLCLYNNQDQGLATLPTEWSFG